MLPERVADHGTPARDEVQDIFRNARFAEDVVEPQPGPRGVLGRLEDERVSGHERRGRHPATERHRKVERCDANEYAEGAEQIGVVFDWRELVHLPPVTVRILHLLRVVVDQVCGFFSIPEGLHAALANLQAHARRNFDLVAANQIGRLVHDRHTLLPADLLPLQAGLVGGFDRLVDVLDAGGSELAQNQIGVDGRSVDDPRQLRSQFLAIDVDRVIAAAFGSDLLERFVESPVDLLHVGRGGRVGDLHRVR